MIAVAFAICAILAALASIVLQIRRSPWAPIAGSIMLALLGAMFLARHELLWLSIFEFAVAAFGLAVGVKALRGQLPIAR